MWPCQNIFPHPRLVMYCFATPPTKLKLGQQIVWGVIRNHLDESLWWANQKHWAAVRSYLVLSSLFCRCIALLRLLPATQLCRPMSDFLHPILLSRITYWAASNFYCPGSHIERQPILLSRITYWAALEML
jgi:hypothetical protein